jgi:NTE family protein
MELSGRSRPGSPEPVRIALVLSAGGLRGAAHVGVLRQLFRHGIPIDAIVGVSAGAVVAAYYAAVGLDFDDLVRDAESFRGRHLLTYSLALRCGPRIERRLAARCGVIPERLRQLEAASFDRLHHGIGCLGIVCHDVASSRPRYFSTGSDPDIALEAAVRASASIPGLFPAIRVTCRGEALRLTDGGVSDAVPLAFARSRGVGATHVIVSDCRWIGRVPPTDASTVWIRPSLRSTGTLWSPARGLTAAIRDGEAAVTGQVVSRISAWLQDVEVTAAGRAHPSFAADR